MAIKPDLNTELPLVIEMLKMDKSTWDGVYDEPVLNCLKALLVEPTKVVDESSKDKWERLERETQALYNDLKETKDHLATEDHAEKMSYFRTATSLLDKLVGLQERAVGLKAIGEFHQVVLDILDDIMEPGQRTEIMQRLEKVIK